MCNMRVAFLTAGGIAPCLSASIGYLIQFYNDIRNDISFVGYLNGYKGLLTGNSINFPNEIKDNALELLNYGGSPIGNSRVKLTNVADCVSKGYVKDGEDPLKVAADQLIKDKINILHTIGGDDTNTMAATLSQFLNNNGYDLTVVGLPKTVDNDVYPLVQTLGAWTAAEQSSLFFQNIVNENTTSSRQLIIHEVMGRNCGWLTAYSAKEYRDSLKNKKFIPEILIEKKRWDVDAIFIPELKIDFDHECDRLKKRMDEKDCINIFLSEGAGTDTIVAEMESKNQKVERDAFGHVALDSLNPGQWFAKEFSKKLKADKTLVQKSGYFARSAAPGERDLKLIGDSAKMAVDYAMMGKSGLIGMDDELDGKLAKIDFERIKGGKPFDVNNQWFQKMLKEIGQI
ncbi:MAG: pyrophosphate--fructose-6-phosphate 1-phosphotransferase [Candidatus Neomarinimicrobiota bacterium]|nr:pyrophosphate--fructose-6-phosphate 1-phosphotransferase [Candidatus Neomarinimicrobiota bacterium]